MFFVDCAVYMYRRSLLSFSLLGGERKMSLVLCVEFKCHWFCHPWLGFPNPWVSVYCHAAGMLGWGTLCALV